MRPKSQYMEVLRVSSANMKVGTITFYLMSTEFAQTVEVRLEACSLPAEELALRAAVIPVIQLVFSASFLSSTNLLKIYIPTTTANGII